MKKVPIFLQYLNSLREGIVEKVTIADYEVKSFMVSTVAEVQNRINAAEKNGDYQEHDEFWNV